MMLPQWADPSPWPIVPDANRNRSPLACANSHQVMGLNPQTIGHRRKRFQLALIYFALDFARLLNRHLLPISPFAGQEPIRASPINGSDSLDR